ncbi:tubulin polyglutamylase complex subunit 2-like isoform X2 [Coccinella septempunctata]|uniref:tubulin polyglutamylase complex subunit 2-like isoform X2 n=1 Tax=Coccinella septempunctata TaxID=41139 RepID=UPI001D07FCE2|nr:tubulin polyglutamylase complex subunit 2-like isoform X2 [Coccinella septempunctata]
MDFVVDRVSEDSFFENLLLGLPKILEEFPCITELHLNRSLPVQHNIICAWEQKHSVLLPEDVRSFYGSTDGFLFSYKYVLADDSNQCAMKGKLEVNCLNDLIQINGYEISTIPGVNMDGERYVLKLGAESKIFILETLERLGKVVLVYINSRYFPNIWIQTENSEFYFLSDDFTTYLRMSIHHMGIPFWQFAYTECGIPDSSKMLFRLMAPSIIPTDEKIEDGRKEMEKLRNQGNSENIPNKIDVGIFRTYYRTSAPNASSIIEQTNSTIISKKKTTNKARHLTTLIKKSQFRKQLDANSH